MEYGTPNKLAWENVKNEMDDLSIEESFFSVKDGQRRVQDTQHARLEAWNLGRNWDSNRRARYWNCLDNDFILGEQEETKV
jgi:hypothetical protein